MASILERPGIPIGGSFKLNSNIPLDPRLVVDDIAERDSIIENNAAYEGLMVYVKSEDKYYICHKKEDELFFDEFTGLSSEQIEQFKLLNDAVKPSKEIVTEIIPATNLYDYTEETENNGEYCYQTYILNTSNIDVNSIYFAGVLDGYVSEPPPLNNYFTKVTSQIRSIHTTHYVRVQAGKTYVLKSNKIVEQKAADNTFHWGIIKFISFFNNNGQYCWESAKYNSTNFRNKGNKIIECGTSGDTYFGTTFVEILETKEYKIDNAIGSGYSAVKIKVNTDGWIRISWGAYEIRNFYGGFPSGDSYTSEDVLSYDNYVEIIKLFQVSESNDIDEPWSTSEDSEIQKTVYHTTDGKRVDELNTQVQNILQYFEPFYTYSKNMYNAKYYTNNNQYVNQSAIGNWNNSNFDIVGKPLTAAQTTREYGKNLSSGWVHLKEAGIYSIQQFKQIMDEYGDIEYGYIGVVLGAIIENGKAKLVFQSNNYMSWGTGVEPSYTLDIGQNGSQYIRGITPAGANITKYTFEKITDEDMYIIWFMANQKGKSQTGYHIPSDSSWPTVSEEEMKEIKYNTMLYKGSSVDKFEEYSEEPINVAYQVGISSVHGLEEKLNEIQSNSAASALVEEITIKNSDKIGFFGNSFFEGYTMEGQHPTVHLGSWLDYILYNYSQSGDDILETLVRVQENKSKFNAPITPKDFNLTYAVIAQQDNDGALHNFRYETYYENSKKLGKLLASYGAIPIFGTEHDSVPYYYNMMRLCKEEGFMFMDRGTEAAWVNPAGFKPFAHSGHPATRTHWSWIYGMKQFFDTLPRPRKSIKLFNARNTSVNNDELLYNTNIERAKVRQDMSAGYTYDVNSNLFDRLCEDNALQTATRKSDYMELHNGNELLCQKSKVLVEFITPYTSTHLTSLLCNINSDADKIYIKRNSSLKNGMTAARGYLCFGIGDNEPSVFTVGGTLVISKGETGNIQGEGIAGSHIIDSVIGDLVVTTTTSVDETSGTDIMEATVNGEKISNLKGSYNYPAPDYIRRWNKPYCEREQIELNDDHEFNINSENSKFYFDFDKVSFLLEKSDGAPITIRNVSAKVSGQGEKERNNNHLICKPISGTSLLSEVDFAKNYTERTISEKSSFPAKLTYQQTTGTAVGTTYTEAYPTGTTSTIEIENGTRMVHSFKVTVTPFILPIVQVRILARHLPQVCFTDNDFNTKNVITKDYYPCGTLKVGFGTTGNLTDCDYFGAIEVGLYRNLFIFNIPIQARSTGTQYLYIYSESDNIQIARVDIDQIDNYEKINKN